MTNDSANTSMKRRHLLKLGAVAAGGAGLVSCASENPERRARNAGDGFDVVIVGAGFAGVTAARELAAKGWRVLVLEVGSILDGWWNAFAPERPSRKTDAPTQKSRNSVD